MMLVLLIIPLLLFLGLQVMLSKYYFKQTETLKQRTKEEVEDIIEKIKTRGQEEKGWKNNFPSVMGWEDSTLLLGKDFVLVSPRSKFPFLFKTYLQPFILTKDDIELRARFNFDRVYKPVRVTFQNSTKDIEVIFTPTGILGQVTIYLTFENLKDKDSLKLERMKNWC
jgi:hypothetical protein